MRANPTNRHGAHRALLAAAAACCCSCAVHSGAGTETASPAAQRAPGPANSQDARATAPPASSPEAPAASESAAPPAFEPMAMGNPRRNGRSAQVVQLGDTPSAIFETGARGVGQPLIDGSGGIYVTSANGVLYALTAEGALRWRFEAGSPVAATPALGARGEIYLATTKGRVVALDARGEPLWQRDLGGTVTADLLIGPDETLYVAGHGLYALDADGTLRFHHVTGDHIMSAPALHPQGFVVFGTMHGRVVAIGLDGEPLWDVSAGAAVSGGASITDDGSIVIGNLLGGVSCLAPDGSLQWLFETEREFEIRATPAISRRGAIAFGSHDGSLYVLSPHGELLHRVPLGGPFSASARIDGEGRALIGSHDQMLHAIDLDDPHRDPRQYNVGQTVVAPIALGKTGDLYVVADHGTLLAIR